MPRLLLIEDDTAVRELLAATLEAEGYEVLTAADGQEAISRLVAMPNGELPSVLLLDLMMPVMDGRDFLAAKSRDDRLRHLPVVVLTAVSPTPTLNELPDSPSLVMSKPLKLKPLLHAVQHYSGTAGGAG